MISKVSLRNFKCFEKLDVEISNLNVFTGINSMGKSTVIQAMLLLRQAWDMKSLDRGLYLKGAYTNLGTGYNILYRNSQKERFSIGITSDEYDVYNEYQYSKDSDYQSIISDSVSIDEPEKVNLFNNNFSYISSERIGPQRYYESSYQDIYDNNNVGISGEYWAGYLAEKGLIDKVTVDEILHEGTNSNLLLYQMEAWMSELSPGIHFDTRKIQEAGIVSLEYKIDSEEYTPVNVGFGLSYVAPIILAILKARKGDLVIIENPEAHLHPKGQRIIGELISKAAAGGVQILVETHSDHLLNGIRLSVKKHIIDRRIIRINYFYSALKNDDKLGTITVHQKCSPMIMEDGSLSSWPDGFFDEWDKAVEELF